jgi:hypothetical protein
MRNASGARIVGYRPPAHTVPRSEHGPDDTTQKTAPSLLEGSYFSAHSRRARRVLYIWNVARRYSSTAMRAIFISIPRSNFFWRQNLRTSTLCAFLHPPDFPTGTSTTPQRTFEKPSCRTHSRSITVALRGYDRVQERNAHRYQARIVCRKR